MPVDALPLDDVLAIDDLMARFATGIDTCDWVMYRSAFADEIDLDYSSWRPDSVGRWRADDWVARATRLFPGLSATRHALTNVLITPLGRGAAGVRASVCADHVVVGADAADAADVFTLNGFYDDRCISTGDGWKIAGKRLVVQWTVGDRGLLDGAAARVAQGSPLRLSADG